ncbi:MAG: thiol reductant ABC exporter subunit CydC [Microbacterium sp.]
MSADPWVVEAERVKDAPAFRRPDLGPVAPRALFALGLAAAIRALGLVLIAEAIARGIAQLTDGTLGGPDIRLALILGVGGALLRSGAEWASAVLARRIATSVKLGLRSTLWRRIADASTGSATQGSGSDAVLAADGLDDLDDYYTQTIPAMVQAAVVPLLVGLRILGADGVSAVVIVVCVPLIPVFMILIGKHTQQRTDEATGALARLADHLTELARGLPVLVGLGRIDEQTRALDGIQRQYRERTAQTLRTAFLSALALELISTISVALVAVLLGVRLLGETMTLQPAIVALVLAPECFAALREVGAAFHASQDGLAALGRAKALLSRPARTDVRSTDAGAVDSRRTETADSSDERRTLLQVSTGGRAVPSADDPTTDAGASDSCRTETAKTSDIRRPVLQVSGLSVRYAGRGTATLNGLTAELSGVVAVAAPSGAGKSTLLAALTGTLPADVEVAGSVAAASTRPSTGSGQATATRGVGYAPQAPAGFTATPREELALYGAADPVEALSELGLAERADAAIPELSPGELRRLAVARALARAERGARLLVLDEPTAHLDAASADLVRSAIRRRADRCTVVLASHEPETLALATSTLRLAPTDAGPSDVRRTENPDSSDSRRTLLRTSHPTDAVRSTILQTSRPWQLLRAVLRPHRGLWAASITLGLLATGLGLALTAVSGWLIVRASVEEHIMYLMVAIVGVRFFGIGRAAGRYAERLVTHRAAFAVVDDLRLRLWRAIAARGAGSKRLLEGGAPVDYLVTLVNDLRDQLPRVIGPIATGILVVIGAGVTTAFVTPHLTTAVLFTLSLTVVAASAAANASERGSGRVRVQSRSRLVRGTAALAHAADDLRGNDVSDAALGQLDGAARDLAQAEHRAARSAGLGGALVSAACAILAVAVPLLSVGTPSALAAVTSLLVLALTEPLTALVAAVQRVPSVRAILLRLTSVLQQAPEPGWGADDPGTVRTLALENVAVQYPGCDHPAVSGVTGAATAGGWLVIDGPSGAGKSTLLSAIMGALPLSHGTIAADGRNLTTLREDAWRSRVAWCPQDAYVFDSTLRGNLLLARAHDDAPTDDDLHDVLHRAGLGPLVSTLPDGLATRVGAGGSALSGGERQRLAVARALLTRADVMLLDEPTAHLDAPTAASMMRDVRAATADRMVVLVSHRDKPVPEACPQLVEGPVEGQVAADTTIRL